MQYFIFISDIENIKKRWRTLRDAFIKHYRLSKTKPFGAAGGKKTKWIYYDQMLFLVPFIEFKETVSSYSSQDESRSSVPNDNSQSEQNVENTETDIDQDVECTENVTTATVSAPKSTYVKQPILTENKLPAHKKNT